MFQPYDAVLWLYDVLVRERRLTRFPEAMTAAFEAGREEGFREGLQEATRTARG